MVQSKGTYNEKIDFVKIRVNSWLLSNMQIVTGREENRDSRYGYR